LKPAPSITTACFSWALVRASLSLPPNATARNIPGLEIAGIQHGYFDKTAGSSENEAVVALINQVKPDILVIGFGMPLQERWLLENWDRLDAKVAIPIGAGFDYLAGVTPRAPRWMTDHGLEWLGRLIIEPRRLWKRYIIGNPLFFYRLVKYQLRLRKQSRKG
jgi:N-acetylglucosaminyldiphosphoundecaprenol N-acetyl-beta-D-mannosaminyltransferase